MFLFFLKAFACLTIFAVWLIGSIMLLTSDDGRVVLIGAVLLLCGFAAEITILCYQL